MGQHNVWGEENQKIMNYERKIKKKITEKIKRDSGS
jgi:hypothetical protein